VKKSTTTFFISFFIFIVCFSFATNLPELQRGGFFSDGGSYFAMIQSLAHDLDLEYTREDLNRIKADFWEGPMGLFLKKRQDGRHFYAKSFAYPLLAAPFFRLFGVHGILLLNGLMILLVILMAYLLLKQIHPEEKSFLFSLIFVLASVVPIYLWWIQADLFNFFIMFCGLFFFFYTFKTPRWHFLSALFFGLAIFSKPSNFVAIGFIYLIPLVKKRWKEFVIMAMVAIVVVGACILFNYIQTGEYNYMGGNRKSFAGKYPLDKPEYTFENSFHSPQMSADNFWARFDVSPKVVLLNGFYFLFGRFTGMFIYFFPAFFLLILFVFQKKEMEDWLILAGIVFSILFYIVVTADNYFGGAGSVGNRYFLALFPLFFFLGFRQRSFKFMYLPVIIGLIFLSGLYLNGFHYSATARLAGLSFPIKLFPPEKTQFQTLPTNANPRAFGRLMRCGDFRYWVYFLNDNYWPVEKNHFWTVGSDPLELLLTTEKEVKEFEVALENIPKKNRVTFQIEHQKHRLNLLPGKSHTVVFQKIKGLNFKNRYIYHIRIKSSEWYCPNFVDPYDKDKRILGVKTQIGITY
jgi:hypothetical protein